MRHLVRLFLALVAVAAIPSLAAAQEAPVAARLQRPAWFAIGMAYDFGGETLVSLTYNDGSTEKLKAEQGFSFYGTIGFGRVALSEDAELDTAASLGVKFWNVGTSGDELDYLVFPLELKERLWAGPFRLGAGVNILLAPRIKGSGLLEPLTVDMDNSFGLVLSAEFIGARKPGSTGFAFGARYTIQKLNAPEFTRSVDANTFGLNLAAEF
jgi:hypothetical protein